MKLPNYNDSMLAITSSIQKYYGIETPYKSMKDLDDELKKGYKHVFFWIIDAMGHYNLQDLSEEFTFVRQHEVRPISAIYPATTVAATTCAQTGLPPLANGCVGWHQYFKEFNNDYVIFFSKGYYDGSDAPVNLEDDYMKKEQIYEKVQKTGKYGSFIFPGFKTPEVNDFADQCRMVLEIANDSNREGFTYIYWDHLDSLMHSYGITSSEVREHAKHIDECLKDLYAKLPEDSLIIMTADHGHVNSTYIDLEEYPDLTSLFRLNPSIESRAQSFYIQDGKQEEFKELFNKHFKDIYHLFTHDEVFEKNILGYGEEVHPSVHDFIGDFFAVALSDKSFKYKSGGPAIGNHAGMTDYEMTTPLVLLTNKKGTKGQKILEQAKNKGKIKDGKNFNKIVGKQKDNSRFRRVNFNG